MFATVQPLATSDLRFRADQLALAVVARGRDYDDVAPLKGGYHGPPSSHRGVKVGITRVT